MVSFLVSSRVSYHLIFYAHLSRVNACWRVSRRYNIQSLNWVRGTLLCYSEDYV